MQEKANGKSPYLSAPKTKHSSFFPKIHRADYRAINCDIIKSVGKPTYNKNESLFKVRKTEKQKNEKEKPLGFKTSQLQSQQTRIVRSKEYQQLEMQIQQMQRKFAQQMQDIEKRKQIATAKAQQVKKDTFQHKLSFWQLKNQILNLDATLRDEQEQYNRLFYSLGYNNRDQQSQEEPQYSASEHDIQDNLSNTQ